jgi:hypothetical protein
MSTRIEDIRPEQETAARWEDYIDVLFSPVALFQRRANDRLLPPMLTLGIATAVVALLMIPVNSRAISASTAGNPQAAEFMEQYGLLFNILGALFAPAFIIVLVLWAAVLLWGATSALSIDVSFRQTVLIATYAGFLYLVAQILGGVLTMVSGPEFDLVRDTSFGVLRFTGAEGIPPVVVPLVRRIDLFAIWQAVLWAIGIGVIGRVSYAKAGLAAAIAFIVYAAPGMLLASLGLGQGPPPTTVTT